MDGTTSSTLEWRQLDLPDADVMVVAAMPIPVAADEVLARLIAETAWRQEDVFVWGKWHRQPRLTAWHGDADAHYTYSGRPMAPHPWTELLQLLRHRAGALAGTTFNSVLLNLYRDGDDRMGFHSDDEPSLGPEPVIASLSYGATRTLKFRHRRRPDLGIVRVPLTEGSLLVMRGGTQAHWRHGIDREAQATGPRVNLTFRRIVG